MFPLKQIGNKEHAKCKSNRRKKIVRLFVNDTTDKGLLSNTNKTIIQFLKWAEDLNIYFTKEDTQMAN